MNTTASVRDRIARVMGAPDTAPTPAESTTIRDEPTVVLSPRDRRNARWVSALLFLAILALIIVPHYVHLIGA